MRSRVWVNGNTTDNSFQVLAAYYMNNSGAKRFWSFKGAGKNAGLGEYMIIYFDSQADLSGSGWSDEGAYPGGPTAKGWYKIPAGASPTDFENLHWYDSLSELVAAEGDANNYGDIAAALTEFTTADIGAAMVGGTSDFANGNLLQLP